MYLPGQILNRILILIEERDNRYMYLNPWYSGASAVRLFMPFVLPRIQKSRSRPKTGNEREPQSDDRESQPVKAVKELHSGGRELVAGGREPVAGARENSTNAFSTVAVCSSAKKINIAGLIAALNDSLASRNVVCFFVELPYNNLDTYRVDREMRHYSRIVLCHSIDNRRFAITDVLDALYDTFLPRAKNFLGKENVAVIVHDFPWPLHSSSSGSGHKSLEAHKRAKGAHMESFQVRQPTTFECCDLALIAGQLGDAVEMDEDDKQKLKCFILKEFDEVEV